MPKMIVSILLLGLFGLNCSAFAKDTLSVDQKQQQKILEIIRNDNTVACKEDVECMVVDDQCHRLKAINKKFQKQFYSSIVGSSLKCNGEGDGIYSNYYKARCSKNRCEFDFDFSQLDAIHRNFQNNVKELVSKIEELKPSSVQNLKLGKSRDYSLDIIDSIVMGKILFYVDNFGRIIQKKQNVDSVKAFFMMSLAVKKMGYSNFEAGFGDIYLTDPLSFELALKENMKDKKIICGDTYLGLMDTSPAPSVVKFSKFEKICGTFKREANRSIRDGFLFQSNVCSEDNQCVVVAGSCGRPRAINLDSVEKFKKSMRSSDHFCIAESSFQSWIRMRSVCVASRCQPRDDLIDF